MDRHVGGSWRGHFVRAGFRRGCHGRFARRRQLIAALVAAVFAVMGATSIALALTGASEPPAPTGAPSGVIPPRISSASTPSRDASLMDGSSSPRAVQPRGPVLARSTPVQLDIASVSIHTRLLRLGLNTDGTLQVPWKPLLAGWFNGSPTPGEVGPSVIAGHVDSAQTGPAVFYRLGQVTPGDRIDVTRTDGTVATFRTSAVRMYAKDRFPTTTVYGDTDRASLRLITCGNWNSSSQEYDGNVVVFAELVGHASAPSG